MNIYHFMPYSNSGNYAEELNRYVSIVPNDDDYICIWDGDTMRTRSQWGDDVKEMIEKNPVFDLLTCLATRTGTRSQMLATGISYETDLMRLHKIVENYHGGKNYKAFETNAPVAGFFLCFKKKLAVEIPFPEKPREGGILGVDTAWCRNLLAANKKIGVVLRLVVIHFYRLNKKRRDTDHLIKK